MSEIDVNIAIQQLPALIDAAIRGETILIINDAPLEDFQEYIR